MGQPARVAARQAALQALRQRRERQAEREKQIDASVYDLAYAFTEREQAVAAADDKASAAVGRLVALGLTHAQVVDNAGGILTLKDVGRLLALAERSSAPENDGGG